MITNTMNIQEIAYEISKDLYNVERFIQKVFPKMRKAAIKRRDKRYYQTFEIKTKRYNNWVVAIDYLERDPSWVIFCTYINNDGYNAVMVCTSSTFSFMHYSGHFLERYNERFLNKELESKTDILKEFILRNNIVQYEFPFNDERFFGVTHDGVVLGYREENIKWYYGKTFITEEMTFDNQQNTFNMASTSYKEYWNEVHCKTTIPSYYSSCTN